MARGFRLCSAFYMWESRLVGEKLHLLCLDTLFAFRDIVLYFHRGKCADNITSSFVSRCGHWMSTATVETSRSTSSDHIVIQRKKSYYHCS